MLTRRIFFVSASGLAVIAGFRWSQQSIAMPEASFEVQKSEAE